MANKIGIQKHSAGNYSVHCWSAAHEPIQSSLDQNLNPGPLFSFLMVPEKGTCVIICKKCGDQAEVSFPK